MGGNLLTASNSTGNHTYTYGDADWKDLLTAFDGQNITYDALGNPLSYYNGTRWNFGWADGRQLMSAVAQGGTTITYTYDVDGTRTVKRVGEVSHTYIWEDSKPLQEWVSGNTDVHTAGTIMYFYYDMNGRPYGLQYNGNIYYYLLNAQGDVIRMLDSTGTTVASYEYDPFGNIITATGIMAEANPLRYRGYYYDRETGFYYLNSRYYDPKIGRFINADSYVSTGQGIVGYNMFAYCGNNPVNGTDPEGQFLEWLWEWGREVLSLTGSNMASMSGGYVTCGGAAVADGPLPFGDMLAVIGGATITIGAFGYAIYQTVTAPSISRSESEEKIKTEVMLQKPDDSVFFPLDPNEFTPSGLVKVYREGTKNGAFISWMDPITNKAVFRWDENPTRSNGPHYHIYGTGHYYPGSIVPEPYATIYFPLR